LEGNHRELQTVYRQEVNRPTLDPLLVYNNQFLHPVNS
jgi:hypothetical protein